MSKESKPRDRWRQLFAAATDRAGHCSGCGYYLAAHKKHRADCTAQEAITQRAANQQAHCPSCDTTVNLNRLHWCGSCWLCDECRNMIPATNSSAHAAAATTGIGYD